MPPAASKPARTRTDRAPPDLRAGVQAALPVLARGFLNRPENTSLRDAVARAELSPRSLRDQLLTVVYRLLFLFMADSREAAGGVPLLRPRGEISAARLLSLAQSPHTGPDRGRLWTEFTRLAGALSGDPRFDDARRDLQVPALGGRLWSPASTPHLGPALADADLLAAVRALACSSPGHDTAPFDFRLVAPEALGAAYESLLSLTPRLSPGDDPAFTLAAAAGHQRKTSGSYYTPDALVQHLLDTALEPVIAEAIANRRGRDAADAVLALRICDPACGAGHFLLAAARRLAAHVARARHAPNPQPALAQVIRRCLYGVDLDPLAVELCKVSLWLEAADPTLPLTFLDDHLKRGNALLGATPTLADDLHPNDARLRADAWCAAFYSPQDVAEHSAPAGADRRTPDDLHRLAAQHGFFHWHLEFPEALGRDPAAASRPAAPAPGFDVVLGNPPFLNQLETATAAARAPAGLISAWSGGVARGYADLSAAFLLLAVTRLTRPGGRVALVQPQALLAVKDAAPVRRAVLRAGSLQSLWVSNEHVFAGASVFTCAPTIAVAGPRVTTLTRAAGRDFRPLPPRTIDNDALAREETWAHLAAAAAGVPEITLSDTAQPRPTLATLADATADFRDQYYGLDGFLIEDAALPEPARTDPAAYPPIVTTGLIDLAECRWGHNPTRLLKARWLAPRIDRGRMERDGALGPWLRARLVPKVILATQTRVIEVFVDARGRFVPSIPLITITPRDPARLWHIAAAVASPVCSVLAMQKYAGAAMSADAIKLSARQVLAMPLPAHAAPWDHAAASLEQAHLAPTPASRRARLAEFGAHMVRAYGLAAPAADEVMAWWSARLGPSDGAPPTPKA